VTNIEYSSEETLRVTVEVTLEVTLEATLDEDNPVVGSECYVKVTVLGKLPYFPYKHDCQRGFTRAEL
jgi:hypothetical protein